MWHDSEVAAIAYAVQNILARRVTEPQQQVLPLEEPASQVSRHAARHGGQEVQ
jgi:ribonucleoside-diphosphate reductase alpha chain